MQRNKDYVLVTGGLGYLGSHTVIDLIKKNYKVIVIDSLINSKIEMIKKINKITKKKFFFYKLDLRSSFLENIFKNHKINFVIHFAGLKSVRESFYKPHKYIDYNIKGSINLFNIMKKYNCKKIIFSSSACVYDEKNKLPFKENSKLNPKSNYGLTKSAVEMILRINYLIDSEWKIVILRYFNPIGCHSSGLIMDNPSKAENIIPKILNVVNKKEKVFKIYGDNYNTKDGTCMRDYIHVSDLVSAHIKAISLLKKNIFEIINIGTGKPYSVKEILSYFSQYLGRTINTVIAKKRDGDVATSYADVTKAKRILNWKSKYSLKKMCKDLIIGLKKIK